MATRDRRPEDPVDEDFLHRWSRRKAKARREGAEPVPAAEGEEPAAAEQGSEPKAIDPADLPDIESLTKDSDFKVFMQKGVPAHLRTLALRKLWRLNPALANLDGLIDYGEDFTDAARIVPNLKTAYEAGKGFAKRVEKVERVIDDDPAKAPLQAPEARTSAAPEQRPQAAAARDSHAPPTEERSGRAETTEAKTAPEDQPRRDSPRRRRLPKRG